MCRKLPPWNYTTSPGRTHQLSSHCLPAFDQAPKVYHNLRDARQKERETANECMDVEAKRSQLPWNIAQTRPMGLPYSPPSRPMTRPKHQQNGLRTKVLNPHQPGQGDKPTSLHGWCSTPSNSIPHWTPHNPLTLESSLPLTHRVDLSHGDWPLPLHRPSRCGDVVHISALLDPPRPRL